MESEVVSKVTEILRKVNLKKKSFCTDTKELQFHRIKNMAEMETAVFKKAIKYFKYLSTLLYVL